ncbi:hypothetical protein KI688_000898 [Linnemannia hyalina]|uniref:Cysteine-rich PDZ-binding protein n=1 Tax=Linnemannia hyalina TaxID=64524 RepID=A0A9P7Y7D0_9FUNG|nr:hypothetical protein KI688_000898 [Linnemannia hyalina]
MVCTKCEKKLAKVICPDKWKDGARNTTVGTSSTAGRKIGENKLLSKKRVTAKFNPYANAKCKTCKSKVHQDAGQCALCGVSIIDTSKYKMSAK